jgi:hypothetical protein
VFAPDAPPHDDGPAAVLATTADGGCVFFERARGNLCAIHRELGADALPAVCRQFPRVVLTDTRGTHISLSHVCPTAAALLQSPQPADFDVVEAPASLTLGGRAEGLEARGVLPPLLRPGMLTDLDGYEAWERRGVSVLARPDVTASQALAVIEAATAVVQRWRPGPIGLREAVTRAFDVASAAKPDEDLDAPGRAAAAAVPRRVRTALQSVPAGLAPPAPCETFEAGWRGVARWWPEVDAMLRAYLAARLFGNWVAYHGQGLHDIIEYLQVALAVVKMEAVKNTAEAENNTAALKEAAQTPSSPWQTVTAAIRNADLLLVHLSDPKALARRLSTNPPA